MHHHHLHTEGSNTDLIYLIANRLPITLKREGSSWTATKSSGGLASGLSGLNSASIFYIGWPGIFVPESDHQTVRKYLSRFNCIPVFLSETEILHFYTNYSNRTLWPVLHYLPFSSQDCTTSFNVYQNVNQKFTDCTVKEAESQRNSVIWVHDYHLLLVPRMLKNASIGNSQIGFFLHTPFPHISFLKQLPQWKQIVHGILGADLIGFHVKEYEDNFNIAVHSLMDEPVDLGQKTFTNPIGINPDIFDQVCSKMNLKEKAAILCRDSDIILGVDRLDPMKGIDLKLQGFREFLRRRSSVSKRPVKLLQIAVPTRTECKEYQDLKKSIHETVTDINGSQKFGISMDKIEYYDQSVNFSTLCELYMAASVLLITSTRDGMNLVAYEYIAAKKYSEDKGVLVISEFAGASKLLSGAIVINPFNPEEIARALEEGLSLSLEQRRERWELNMRHVLQNTSVHWASRFLERLGRPEILITPTSAGGWEKLSLNDEELAFPSEKEQNIGRRVLEKFKSSIILEETYTTPEGAFLTPTSGHNVCMRGRMEEEVFTPVRSQSKEHAVVVDASDMDLLPEDVGQELQRIAETRSDVEIFTIGHSKGLERCTPLENVHGLSQRNTKFTCGIFMGKVDVPSIDENLRDIFSDEIFYFSLITDKELILQLLTDL
jgi:trehalose 6-phosphate synthase